MTKNSISVNITGNVIRMRAAFIHAIERMGEALLPSMRVAVETLGDFRRTAADMDAAMRASDMLSPSRWMTEERIAEATQELVHERIRDQIHRAMEQVTESLHNSMPVDADTLSRAITGYRATIPMPAPEPTWDGFLAAAQRAWYLGEWIPPHYNVVSLSFEAQAVEAEQPGVSTRFWIDDPAGELQEVSGSGIVAPYEYLEQVLERGMGGLSVRQLQPLGLTLRDESTRTSYGLGHLLHELLIQERPDDDSELLTLHFRTDREHLQRLGEMLWADTEWAWMAAHLGNDRWENWDNLILVGTEFDAPQRADGMFDASVVMRGIRRADNTAPQPDSHPACRCALVPVPADNPRPLLALEDGDVTLVRPEPDSEITGDEPGLSRGIPAGAHLAHPADFDMRALVRFLAHPADFDMRALVRFDEILLDLLRSDSMPSLRPLITFLSWPGEAAELILPMEGEVVGYDADGELVRRNGSLRMTRCRFRGHVTDELMAELNIHRSLLRTGMELALMLAGDPLHPAGAEQVIEGLLTSPGVPRFPVPNIAHVSETVSAVVRAMGILTGLRLCMSEETARQIGGIDDGWRYEIGYLNGLPVYTCAALPNWPHRDAILLGLEGGYAMATAIDVIRQADYDRYEITIEAFGRIRPVRWENGLFRAPFAIIGGSD